MLKILTIRKSNNKVEAISDGLNEVSDLFEQKKVNLTKKQVQDIDEAFESFYDKDLVCVKNPNDERKEKIDEIIGKVNSATTVVSLKEEILNLLNIIK